MFAALIVDDDPTKRRHIREALLNVEGIEAGHLHEVDTVSRAKQALRNQEFDLVVLDIALPLVEGGQIERDAGVRLLDEVLLRSDRYKTPSHIVGLTGFDDIQRDYSARFTSRLWTIAKYLPDREEWARSLQTRARHILNASRAGSIPDFGVDCCVATALFDPELTGVLALDCSWEQDEANGDHAIYHRGRLAYEDRPIELVAFVAPRMGMPATAVAVSKAIARYRPKLVAVCGIMAGVEARTGVGDVIVSTQCWDWGSGKWSTDLATGERSFSPAPHLAQISPEIRERVRGAAADEGFLTEPWSTWRGLKPQAPPRLRMGPTSSGAAVLADQSTIEMLVRQHRELMGIEMELYGALVAAEEAVHPRPAVVSLKAVVDFADGSKSDDYQAFGAHMSARALHLLLPRLLRS